MQTIARCLIVTLVVLFLAGLAKADEEPAASDSASNTLAAGVGNMKVSDASSTHEKSADINVVDAKIADVKAGDTKADDASADDTKADDAWIGEYSVIDVHGTRSMTVIRDASRIEYRLQHAPIRVWRHVMDGVALQELYPERGIIVVYPPGDLRAENREPDWNQISTLVDPQLREQLEHGRSGTVLGESIQRYTGHDAQHHKIELDWLTASAMPARYRIAANDTNTAEETIELRTMHRLPAAQAFTRTEGLRETDGIDQGD